MMYGAGVKYRVTTWVLGCVQRMGTCMDRGQGSRDRGVDVATPHIVIPHTIRTHHIPYARGILFDCVVFVLRKR